jgi:hypothetical protein
MLLPCGCENPYPKFSPIVLSLKPKPILLEEKLSPIVLSKTPPLNVFE